MRVDRAELLGGEIPLRPLGVAEMLDAALAVLRRAPRAVLGPAVVVVGLVQFAVTIVGYVAIGDQASDEITPNVVLRSLGSQLVLASISALGTGIGILLLAGLIAPVIARSYYGLPLSYRQAWNDVRPRLGALVVVALVVAVGSLTAGALALVPFVAVAGTDGSASLGILFAVIGFPLAFVVTVWLYVLGVLAAPAVVVERLSVRAAFSRARRLVRGQWWRTCMVLVLTGIITIFMGFIGLRVPFVVGELVLFGADPTGWREIAALAVNTLGRIVSWTITAPFDAGVIALVYLDRRMRREGLDLELQTRDELPGDFLSLWRAS